MISKACVWGVAVVGILSLADPGSAQRMPEKSGELPKPPAPVEKPPANPETLGFAKRVTGEVISVNPAARTLVVVTSDRKEMSFLVASQGMVGLAEFKPGDTVTVYYIEGAGRFVAELVSRG